MTDSYENYINGEWRPSETGETFEIRNPADNEEVVAHVQDSSSEDATDAIEAATAAQSEWAGRPASERRALLRETAKRMDDRADELAETLSREEGKTLTEASGEVSRAINIFYYYAEQSMEHDGTRKPASNSNQNLYTVREPMGVAGLIVPWNYPIAIPSWKMAPALATGNTVVCKLSGPAPTVFLKVAECLDAAADVTDTPDGTVNVLTGGGEEVGNPIVEHDAVDAVSFTGSQSVGDMIYGQATDNRKRVQTEMGSKNPTVVTANADIEEAVQVVGDGVCSVTGQACTATERVIVDESVHDEFVDGLIEYVDSVDIGPGLEDPGMGPQVNESELDSTLDYVETAKDEGATLAYGGGQPEGSEYENGHFVEPTVFTDAESDMAFMQEEVFGPFAGVVSYSDFEEAIELANDVEFGLSASIVTQDHTEANRFIEEVDFGVMKVNEATSGLDLHVPFGGMNASSSETYREQGQAGMDYFTIIKTVYESY